MALNIKQVIVKSKIRQARLKAIKKLIQGIPANPRFDMWDEEQYVWEERAKSELANEIRKILNTDPFEGRDAYRPGKKQG